MGLELAASNGTALPLPDVAAHRAGRRRLVLGLFVVLGGIAVSLLLGWLSLVRERQLAEVQFRLDAEKRIEAIQRAVVDRLGMVGTVAAFFSGSQLVERKEFRTFADPMFGKHPGVEALAWVPRIPAARREAHERAVRREGLSTYTIGQRDEQERLIPADKRDEYYPILFLEPSMEDPPLLGLDLGSDAAFRMAIQQALTTRRQVAAVCPSLIGKAGGHSLLYVLEPAWNEDGDPAKRPADQPEIDGFVLGVFRVCTAIEKALNIFTPVGIDIYITGSADASGRAPLYKRLSPLHVHDGGEAPANATSAPPTGGIRLTGSIDVANLRCTAVCVPMASCLARQRTCGPAATLVTGLAITGLLAGYLLLLTGRTARVEKLVAERTRELSESERRFRRLVDNAGDAFFLHDVQGTILDVSRRACDSLGYTREELLSMTVAEVDIDFIAKDLTKYSRRRTEEYPVSFEGVHRRKDGTTFPVEIRLAPLEAGGQRMMLALVRDITDRKKLEESLREGERKLHAILDQTYQFIGLMTPDGILTAANKTALAFSGVSEQSVLNKPFWETPWWTHSPGLQEELRLAVKRAAQGEFVRMEATHLAANGDLHWIDFSLKPVKDESGKVKFLIPEGRDITDRKRAEEAILQEQRLLRDMIDLQERDRRLVAYEIHDGLAQQLTAAMYKFQAVGPLRNRDPKAALEAFDDGMRLLREAMLETRRLIGGLRPPVLDELGIVVAVDYMIAEWRQRGGPKIEFVHEEEFGRLAPPLESALFRIVQECLTNACRYSQSDKVRVELARGGDRVRAEVRDWGVGFDPAEAHGEHFGLRGIRERARLLGGSVAIQSAPGQGARIIVELPLVPQTETGGARVP